MGKIKGSGILLIVKALRANKHAAAEALPERLRPYLRERVMVSSWYPEEDYLELLKALKRAMGDDDPRAYEAMGSISARVDLSGLYKHHLFEGDPAKTLRRGIQVWPAYHDTGRMTLSLQADDGPTRRAVLELVGYEMACQETCSVNSGWMHTPLSMAGATEVEVLHDQCAGKGADACRWEAKWRDPAEA